MSIVPTTTQTPALARSLSVTPPSQAPSSLATLDPFKLVQKYKFWLVAAVILGAMAGAGAHFVLLRVYPVYRAFVLFEVRTPAREIGSTPDDDVNKQEFDRFMLTQVRILSSDVILQRVAEDPRLLTLAPKWSDRFKVGGVFAAQDALRELREKVGARMLPDTRLIEVSMGWTDKTDVTSVVRLVKEAYMNWLRQSETRVSSETMNTLVSTMNDQDREIKNLQDRRERLIQDREVQSLNQQTDEAQQKVVLLNEQLVEVLSQTSVIQQQLLSFQRDANAPVINYPALVREEVENTPQLLQLKGLLDSLQAERQSQIQQGFQPEHRSIREIESRIDGYQQAISEARQRLMRQRFESMLDGLRQSLDSLEARQAALVGDRDETAKKLTDLTRTKAQLEDWDRQVAAIIESKAAMSDRLSNLRGITNMEASRRVQVAQDERIPQEVSFPKLLIMVPAGTLVIAGLTVGFVLLRELMDQRVKGPADIAVIPRTRVLGWIPDASEDPSDPGAAETAFRDRSRGVTAESFRQLRSSILKRLLHGQHRTVVVLAGMPGSGATTVVSNVALAAAATDLKVLVIDANFRRPSLHRVLAVSDSPGLADILSGQATLDSALQTTSDGVSILSAGTPALRLSERLSTTGMAALLAQVRARFDLVLVDVAPAIVSSDGLALANLCDASVLVTKALSEKRGMVARIKNDLADSRGEFLGVVVNAVRGSAGGYLRGNIRASHEYQNAKDNGSSQRGAA